MLRNDLKNNSTVWLFIFIRAIFIHFKFCIVQERYISLGSRHPNCICNVHSTAVQSAQNKNIGFWLVKNILFPICSTHRIQSISLINATFFVRCTAPNQSVHTSNGGFWLVKNILFPICSTHRIQSISPTHATFLLTLDWTESTALAKRVPV